VALVRTDVSEERVAFIISVETISELGRTLAVTSVLTKATRHQAPEEGILHSDRLESLKSYIELTGWAL
jgi:hypothetical protein